MVLIQCEIATGWRGSDPYEGARQLELGHEQQAWVSTQFAREKLAEAPSDWTLITPSSLVELDDIPTYMAELEATTNGSAGADLIGATAISGWSGATVQAILESAKAAVDAKRAKSDVDLTLVSGDISASVAATLVAIAKAAGKITTAGFSIATAGADATDPLSYELDVLINGVTIFDTKPKLTYNPATAAAGACTLIAGTGVTVGVIDDDANDVVLGDKITVTLTRTATTPDTEGAGAFVALGLEYTVVSP